MLKFDDQFPLHRKVDALSDAAFRLHVEAIFWCARHLTDGWIAQVDLDTVSRKVRAGRWTSELCGRGAWHRIVDGRIVDDCQECPGRYGQTLEGDGYLIHGFLDWQQTRTKVLQIREQRRRAGSAGGKRSASVRASRVDQGETAGHNSRRSKQGSKRSSKTTSGAQPPSPSPSKEGKGDARAAPLGAPRVPSAPTSPVCPTCGNRTDTAYHRNNCAEIGAA